MTRISKFVHRTMQTSPDDSEKIVNDCKADGLIIPISCIGARGSKRGVENTAYKIPAEITHNFDDCHDWYCHVCHTSGDVICCKGCHRVFHHDCGGLNGLTKLPFATKDSATTDKPDGLILNNITDGINKLTKKENLTDKPNVLQDTPPGDLENFSEVKTPQDQDKSVDVEDKVPKSKDYIIEIIESDCESNTPQELTAETVKDKSVKNESVKDESVKDEAVKDESVKDESVKDESVKDESVKDETVKDKNFKNESVKDDTEVKEPVLVNNATMVPKDLSEQNETVGSDDLEHCSVCQLLRYEKSNVNLENTSKEEINYLLTFTFNRIESWLPEHSLFINAIDSEESKIEDVEFRIKSLLKHPVTLGTVKQKLKDGEYTAFTQFHGDILDIQHAMALLHGMKSEEMKAATYMVTDCQYDLRELQQCRDCYRHSNNKEEMDWFAKPCNPKHVLVYAKQKGYNFWPAKVIKMIDNDQYDVRFFGTNHLRAAIDFQNVKPIDTPMEQLKITKKSNSFNKAMEELRKHQDLLKKSPLLYSFDYEQKSVRGKPIALLGLVKMTVKTSMTVQRKTKTTHKVVPIKASKVFKKNVNSKLKRHIKVIKKKQHTAVKLSKNQKCSISAEQKKDINIYNFSEDNNCSYLSENCNNGEVTSGTSKNGKENIKRKTTTPTLRSKRIKLNKASALTNETLNTSSEEPHKLDKKLDRSSQEALITSTQDIHFSNISSEVSNGVTAAENVENKAAYCDVVDGLKQSMMKESDPAQAREIALETLQNEIEKWQVKMRNMVDEQNVLVSEVKKKQWCFNCEQEAIYHCCWNTAYCSTLCQQHHWQTDHKKVCRRKR